KAPAGFEARLQAAIQERTVRPALSPERLEQLVHRELRSLPLRRAPRSLEARVLAALEHQAAVAWYHKSWSYWPAAVRAAFLAFATAVTGGVLAAFYLVFNGVDTGALAAAAGARLGFFTKLYHAAVWTADFTANVFGSIPSLWLYGGVALVAALYATFFGLGAAAYRTLYRHN
ncbi:MAG: hypothetical protein PSW75_00935, partial [bacterium]|nr:hypothetical protein [bacterium]